MTRPTPYLLQILAIAAFVSFTPSCSGIEDDASKPGNRRGASAPLDASNDQSQTAKGDEPQPKGDETPSGQEQGTPDDTDDDRPDDDRSDDDPTSNQPKQHDGTIQRTAADDPFSLKIESIVSGKVLHSHTLNFADRGQALEGNTLKNSCQTNAKTCLRLTFIGQARQVVGDSPCTSVMSVDGNRAVVSADTKGKRPGSLGNCQAGVDELIEITCPESDGIEIGLCDE